MHVNTLYTYKKKKKMLIIVPQKNLRINTVK